MIDRRQSTDYNGIWWLPTDSDDKPPLHGILRYTPHEGFNLEVIGSFFDLSELFSRSQNPVIIKGTSSDGRNITLYRCIGSSVSLGSRSIGPKGIQTSIYKPSFVFIGAHFDEEPLFSKLFINYSFLDEWVNISGFKIPMPSTSGEITIKYKMPEDVSITLDENYELTITHSVQGPNLNMVQKESRIKQTTYVRIASISEIPLSKYHDLINNFRNFLSFGVDKPVFPLSIFGESEGHFSVYKDKKIYDKIEIYYNTGDFSGEGEPIIPPNMFFAFKDISESFESFIKNWFNKSIAMSPVFDLYFSNVYTPKMYSETRFLNAVQAIESYHRRKDTTKKLEIPIEEHNERVIKILSFAPLEYMDWLLEKLRHSNEVYLRMRLMEILALHKDIAEIYIGDKRQQKDFVYRVTATRHYLTHFDVGNEANCAKGTDLLILTEKLKLIIKSCLLEEIGMDHSKIKAILENYKARSFLSWKIISWD